jgi:hypothetical protein
MPFRCKNMEGCYMYNLLTTSVRIIRLQPFLTGYCEDAVKYRECARYKVIETGKEPPSDLLPDGKKLTA